MTLDYIVETGIPSSWLFGINTVELYIIAVLSVLGVEGTVRSVSIMDAGGFDGGLFRAVVVGNGEVGQDAHGGVTQRVARRIAKNSTRPVRPE